MITLKDIQIKMKKLGVPDGAIFGQAPKRLVWGGEQILNGIFDNKLDWTIETLDCYDELFYKICDSLSKNPHIILWGVSGGVGIYDYRFAILADENLKNEIELVGGLENYIKIGG